MIQEIGYYLRASYRRKIIDNLLQKNSYRYKGIVLDIGGRDRGKFRSPKEKVEKWTTTDIEESRKPDMVLDVANMNTIGEESIDVINAIELFEHVDKIEDGLSECFRVLRVGGIMMLSVPFLYPIHADPHDYQRWTEQKWKTFLPKIGFRIEKIERMGGFFTIFCDAIKNINKNNFFLIRYFIYLFYPLFDMLVKLDGLKVVRESAFGKYAGGYFIIALK